MPRAFAAWVPGPDRGSSERMSAALVEWAHKRITDDSRAELVTTAWENLDDAWRLMRDTHMEDLTVGAWKELRGLVDAATDAVGRLADLGEQD